MKQDDLVSVIVPVYQVRPYLERCVESIRNQTYTNIEIILVDDGSSDGSEKLCDQYSKVDTRIRVIHKNNGGHASARNAGAASARNTGMASAWGKWYCFVDSDDYIAPDYVEYLLNLCKKNRSEMACCMYEIVYENGGIQDNYVKQDAFECEKLYSAEEFTYYLLCDKVASYTWNKIYSAALWKDLKFDEAFCIYEDSTTLYKVAARCTAIACGGEAKYYYAQRGTSLLHENKGMRNIIAYFSALQIQEDYVKEHDIKTSKEVPFDLLRLENYRRYLNCSLQSGTKNDAIKPYARVQRNKKLALQLLQYTEIFDKKSIASNLLLLISESIYLWQRRLRG